VPGFGHQSPNPWGLGPEKRGHKSPHWTAPSSSAETYGHFGRAGTMLWIDPEDTVTLVALCTEPFGPWAATAWPLLSETVLAWARSIDTEPRSTTN
ncbi:MAG: serine hydrolase, partial [Acidimicrobiales bacterium]